MFKELKSNTKSKVLNDEKIHYRKIVKISNEMKIWEEILNHYIFDY